MLCSRSKGLRSPVWFPISTHFTIHNTAEWCIHRKPSGVQKVVLVGWCHKKRHGCRAFFFNRNDAEWCLATSLWIRGKQWLRQIDWFEAIKENGCCLPVVCNCFHFLLGDTADQIQKQNSDKNTIKKVALGMDRIKSHQISSKLLLMEEIFHHLR